MSGKFVQVIAKEIWAIFFTSGFKNQAEVQKMFGERQFFGCGKVDPASCLRDAAPAENTANARISVLQIRSRISSQGEHFIPTEHIVALAIGQKVGVLDSADAHHASNLAPLRFGKLGVFFAHDHEGALFGFLEEIRKLHSIPSPRFERLAVFTKD